MDRITVSSEELQTAISVWLHVMPKHIWRELEKHKIASLEKRQGTRPDVEAAVAAHIVEHLGKARWEVTREQPIAHIDGSSKAGSNLAE